MIIIDYSQVCISAFFANFKNADISVDYFRHLVLNSIRFIKTQFREYGEVVIAVDSGNVWRKQVFPYYKANRSKDKDTSDIDWNLVYQYIAQIRDEIDQYFPYKVIKVDGAEADDIIGVLINEFGSPIVSSDKHIIISADKDFIQLQKYMNVTQYDPIREKEIVGNAKEYLFEHIIRGDSGDGVPSIRSADAVFIEKIRQKPITQKWIDELKSKSEDELRVYLTEQGLIQYYDRNKAIIDLDNTPADLKEKILAKYNEPKKGSNIAQYFIDNGLKILYTHINEF